MWRPTPTASRSPYHYDRVVLVLLAALLALSPPVVAWWSRDGAVWYLPYLIWLGLILLIALALRGYHVDADPDPHPAGDDAPPP